MGINFTTYYADVKKLKAVTLKGRLRNIALSSLALTVNKNVLKKPRVHILYLHHLFTDEEANFRKLMALLAEDHQFISYSEAVSRILSGNIDKPYIAFSSDDGFKNNLAAARILEEYNATACFFVNPGIIGETDPQKIKKHCVDTLAFPPVEFLDWKELTQLQQKGHEIGNHTMMHMNIAAHSADQVKDDLHQSLQLLKSRCNDVQHFAFPYGRFSHFSEAGRKAVFETGHFSCTTAERGCHVKADRQITNTELCIHREHTVLGWSIGHIMYFLAKSAATANPANNFYPPDFI